MERINEPYNNDADLIRRLHAFLERYGFINFGVFKIEKPIPKANIRIGVIGAGVSGLIAARQLKYFGFDVMVFEGRKEVGGRIRTYQNGRYIADLGAMIVTGLGGNPTAVLARQVGLSCGGRGGGEFRCVSWGILMGIRDFGKYLGDLYFGNFSVSN